ncbi:LuxR C-terminal-related transcriptional regulator [Propionicimonas sp.]|uniref:helix-turn-helix transcriptional regulator n=1 Tax=Propionicimonas sp. TaxID=1955623 RepID=UPI0039E36BB1
MAKALAAERVRRDVEVLARAGLDLDTFLTEAMVSLGRALPFDGACVCPLDPSTGLPTSTFKLGNLHGVDTHDHEWGLVEYGASEPTALLQLRATGVLAAGIRARTVSVEPSIRIEEFMRPYFGFVDELRAICRDDRGQVWAGIALFRDGADARFDADEVDYLGSLSGSFALGLRSGLLAGLGDSRCSPAGPIVLIVDATDEIVRMSSGASERLAGLIDGTAGTAGVIGSVIGAARRYARGETAVPARSRIRAADGRWLVLHATMLSAKDGSCGEVVVTIEEARPPEIVPLVVAAFGLTPRERDITQLVLQGVDTKEIAAQLYLSAYTVQDHLKSVFDKAGVRSRRELIARVYFDQYVPRLHTALGPSGWFLGQPPAGPGVVVGTTSGP